VAEIRYTNKHKGSLGTSVAHVLPAPDIDENPLKEIATPGYSQRAFERAQRRKSPWNLILLPLSLVGWFLCGYILWFSIWHIHTLIYPEHAGIGLTQLMGSHTTLPLLLMLLPLLLAGLPPGLMLANCVAWCIPPARSVFDREAEGVKGTSFRASQSGLWRLGKIVIVVCILLSLAGAVAMKNLN
jgi:hypothetical protein